MSPLVRVLVVDDSASERKRLLALLAGEPRCVVVGEAADGVEALVKARNLRPDVITMDAEMPRLDGLLATEAIMAEAPARVLILCPVDKERNLDISFRAMAAGALEVIRKPPASAGEDEQRDWGRRLAETIVLMSEVPVVRRQRRPPAASPSLGHAGTMDFFALVASTGGPPALAQVLGALPRSLPIPLLVAQHIARGFIGGLVRWLAAVSPLVIEVAADGARALPGHVYLPPDGRDLELAFGGLLRTPASTSLHCPSGNRLLHSLARICRSRAGAIVMTGMGDDGTEGLLALRNAGGATFAQDESTSVVFGMPHAAHAGGAAESLLALENVAPAILELCAVQMPHARGPRAHGETPPWK